MGPSEKHRLFSIRAFWDRWRFREVSEVMGVPHIIQVMDDHDLALKHIKTHGDLGNPNLKTHGDLGNPNLKTPTF